MSSRVTLAFLEHRLHFREKVVLQFLLGTRERPHSTIPNSVAIDHCGDDLPAASWSIWGRLAGARKVFTTDSFTYLLPFAFPTSPLLQRVYEGMRCCSVSFPTGVGHSPCHSSSFVFIFGRSISGQPWKETAVKLICGCAFPDTTHRPEVYLSASHDH